MGTPYQVPCNEPKDIFVLAECFHFRGTAQQNPRFKRELKDAGRYEVTFGITSIVIYTFSIELFLKCICCMENKTFFYSGHELDKLFSYLSQSAQDRIVQIHDDICNKDPLREAFSRAFGDELFDFHKMLTQSSKAFTEFRYKFDVANLRTTYHLGNAGRAIRQYIIDANPEWHPIITYRNKPT
jgi:hypothetical protein